MVGGALVGIYISNELWLSVGEAAGLVLAVRDDVPGGGTGILVLRLL